MFKLITLLLVFTFIFTIPLTIFSNLILEGTVNISSLPVPFLTFSNFVHRLFLNRWIPRKLLFIFGGLFIFLSPVLFIIFVMVVFIYDFVIIGIWYVRQRFSRSMLKTGPEAVIFKDVPDPKTFWYDPKVDGYGVTFKRSTLTPGCPALSDPDVVFEDEE